MRPIYPITQTTTVTALVELLYDVYDPATQANDADKIAGAARALRALNASLPSDDSDVLPATTPWIYLYPIPRTPWRIPPVTQSLRDALASLDIRNVDTMAQTTVSFLMNALSSPPAQSVVEKLHGICRLMRVDAMDPVNAEYLYDHATTPVQEPADLVTTSQATLKSMVEAHVTAGFPSELTNGHRPWFQWQVSAMHMTGGRKKERVYLFPIPFQPATLDEHIDHWKKQAASAERVSEARTSAGAMQWLLELQQDYLAMNVAVRKRDPKSMDFVQQVWETLGSKAVELGVITSSSAEATGPSLDTVMDVIWRVVDDLDPEDVELQKTRMGLRGARTKTDGLRGFSMADLQASSKTTVIGALDSNQIATALGLEGLRVLERAYTERNWQGLPTAMKTDVTIGHNASRVVDFERADQQKVTRNLRSLDLPSIKADSGPWQDVQSGVSLRSMRAAIGTCLDSGGQTPTATSVLESSTLPTDLTNNMTPFERYIAFTSSAAPGEGTFYAPISSSFPARYKADVMESMFGSDARGLFAFDRQDFGDLTRFAFILPLLVGLSTRAAAAKSVKDTKVSRSLWSLTNWTTTNITYLCTITGEDYLSAGAAAAAAYDVDCSNWWKEERAIETLRDLNRAGDYAYINGDLEEAIACYETVIKYDEMCQGSTFKVNIVEEWENVVDEVLTTIQDDRPHAFINQALKYQIPDDVDPELTAYWLGPVIDFPRPDQYTSATAELLTQFGTEDIAPIFYSSDSDGLPNFNPFGSSNIDYQTEEVMSAGLGIPGRDHTYATRAVYDSAEYTVEVLHALQYREQALQSLNWLGFDPHMVPPWRFDWLLSNARYFGSKADELQQRAMQLLAAAEGKTVQELEATNALAIAIAEQGTLVAEAQVALAEAQTEAAEKSRAIAEKEEKWAKQERVWAYVDGANHIGERALQGFQTGGWIGAIIGGVVGTVESAHSVQQAYHNVTRAQMSDDLALSQITVAQMQETLATTQVALATLQEDAARSIVTLLEGQQLDSNAYYDLTDIIEGVASSYLHMANRLAWLAERAYQWETKKRHDFIKQSYWDFGTLRGRFAGAGALLNDLDAMEHERITTGSGRSQVIRTTFSLRRESPASLMQLREAGGCLFRVTPELLDERFPGLYLHSLKRVEVNLVGLLPASGVTGILSTTNSSTVRVPNNEAYVASNRLVAADSPWYPFSSYPLDSHVYAPPFVRVPFNAPGLSQVLSQYTKAKDSVVLGLPEGMLDAFENLPPDLEWLLELPPQANGFDFSQIVDVEFIYYFTAYYSEELAARQEAVLATETVDRSVTAYASMFCPDSMAAFTTTPSDTSFKDIRLLSFELATSDLPAHLKDHALKNFSLGLHREDNDSVSLSLRMDGSIGEVVASTDDTATSPNDQQVYTAIGDSDIIVDSVTLHASRAGTYTDLESKVSGFGDPTGTWVVKILPEDNSAFVLKDDDGDDVVVTSGTVTLGSSGASLSYDSGDWKHFEVQTSIKPTVPTSGTVTVLELALRDTGSASVSLTLDESGNWSATDGTNTDSGSLASDFLLDGRWTRVKAQLVQSTLTLWLDGVQVLSTSAMSAGPSSGSVTLKGADLEVADVRITRLRYDGTSLEELVSETFDATPTDWTLTSSTWASSTHKVLDLSFLEDVTLTVDFTAKVDFPS